MADPDIAIRPIIPTGSGESKSNSETVTARKVVNAIDVIPIPVEEGPTLEEMVLRQLR